MASSPFLSLVVFLVIVGTPALLGVIAVELGCSRLRWSAKAGVLALILIALLPTKLTTSLFVLAWALSGITLITALVRGRWYNLSSIAHPQAARANRLQFRLADLLLLTLAVGAATAIARPREDSFGAIAYSDLAILSLTSVALGVCAFALSAGRYGWICLPLIAGLSFVPAYFSAPGPGDLIAFADVIRLGALPWQEAKPWAYVWAYFLEVTLLAAIGIALIRQTQQPSPNGLWRIVLAAYLVLLGGPAIFTYYDLVRPPVPYPPSLSGPNHFDQLAKTCADLQTLAPYHFNQLDLPILLDSPTRIRRAELYEEILQQAKLPSYLPDRFARDSSLSQKELLDSIRPFVRRAAHDAAALAPENPERSAEIAQALVKIGSDVQHNGLHVGLVIGISFESFGMRELIRVRQDLPPATSRRILAELLRIDAAREPMREISRREQAWCERHLPPLDRLGNTLQRFALGQQAFAEQYLDFVDRRDAFLRLLAVDLALRLYAGEQSDYPEHLDQLIPAYLRSLPLDPYSNRPPIYRPVGNTFVLYSVGPNRRDDDAQFDSLKAIASSPGSAMLDLDLDTALR